MLIAAPLLTISQPRAQSEIDTISVGNDPNEIAFNPDNGDLYLIPIIEVIRYWLGAA